MKTMVLILALFLAMAGVVDAQVRTLVGPLSINFSSTEQNHITDKWGYDTRKLVNLSFRFTGSISLFEVADTPSIQLDLAAQNDCGTVTITVTCPSNLGGGVSSKANNTNAVANDQVRMQYSCHLTLNDFEDAPACTPRTSESDAVSLYLKGTMRREKGDVTDTITKLTLSGCTLSGSGQQTESMFKGTFSSVLLPQ